MLFPTRLLDSLNGLVAFNIIIKGLAQKRNKSEFYNTIYTTYPHLHLLQLKLFETKTFFSGPNAGPNMKPGLIALILSY